MIPGSPEWQRKVTASKVAAILGVSPFDSPRSVWHQMRGELPAKEQSDVMSRGHYLEPAILAWWRDRHQIDEADASSWRVQPTYSLGDWAAATPDAVAHVPNDMTASLVEAKSAAYDDEWGREGTDEIPAYYLVQCQWQMHVSGVHRCYVPIITSRLRFAEYVVDYDAETGPLLEERMREFYDSLSADTPPPLDDSVATFTALRRLHPEINKGEVAEIDPAAAVELLSAVFELDQCEARVRIAKATALDAMGRAQYLNASGVRVARRQANKSGVSFVPLTQNLYLLTESESVA